MTNKRLISILLYLHERKALIDEESILLKKSCDEMGVHPPIDVYSSDELEKLLEKYCDDEIILFTNFPPNSKYPESDKEQIEEVVNGHKQYAWEADSYSKSRHWFRDLNDRYSFKAVHFISGAPEVMVRETLLQSLFPNSVVTLKRKGDWIDPELDYFHMYRHYLEERIRESVEDH